MNVDCIPCRTYDHLLKTELDSINHADMPRLACLLDLLADHPAMAAEPVLASASNAIRELLMQAWERLEAAASLLHSPETHTSPSTPSCSCHDDPVP